MMQMETIDMIGSSPAMKELKAEIERVARPDAKVLITGESGVGKELVARALGAANIRANAPFVPVNCAGIPETLLESELFGHVKGSFTGAYRDKPGKLEMANNGTIFLDEIGEMTLRMQGLLLRFLETGEIQKVGADGSRSPVNPRDRRDQPQPARDDRAGAVSRGSVLPAQRHPPGRAAAAGAARGHPAADRSFPPEPAQQERRTKRPDRPERLQSDRSRISPEASIR